MEYDTYIHRVAGPASELRTVNQADKSAVNFSPKGKLTWSPMAGLRIGAAIGQAYRYPTASELFQTTTVGTGANAISVNGNPNLKPEEALASELSGEYFADKARLRVSLFQERVRNAIFSQIGIVSRIRSPTSLHNQLLFQMSAKSILMASKFPGRRADAVIKGLDILGNLTWVDSRIEDNQ